MDNYINNHNKQRTLVGIHLPTATDTHTYYIKTRLKLFTLKSFSIPGVLAKY